MDLVQETVWVALSEYVPYIISNRIHIFLPTTILLRSEFIWHERRRLRWCVLNHLPYEITTLTSMLHFKNEKNYFDPFILTL